MALIQLYSLFESATFLQNPALYQSLGIEETRFTRSRSFNKAIADKPPDIILAEFIYGYANNYAGVNISNLDVSLYALQRYAPQAKIVLFADKLEFEHIPKLKALFKIQTALTLPVSSQKLRATLADILNLP